MGKSLITESLNDGLMKLNQFLFNGNRLLDRMMTNLVIQFAMYKTESVLHPLLAHFYPKVADKLGNYIEGRNQIIGYLDTPTDLTIYETPIELFEKYYEYQEDLENLIKECISLADDEGDVPTRIFLENFLLDMTIYTKQAIWLKSKASICKDWMIFDEYINSFIIPELQGSDN